jgi:hypothetical protein
MPTGTKIEIPYDHTSSWALSVAPMPPGRSCAVSNMAGSSLPLRVPARSATSARATTALQNGGERSINVLRDTHDRVFDGATHGAVPAVRASPTPMAWLCGDDCSATGDSLPIFLLPPRRPPFHDLRIVRSNMLPRNLRRTSAAAWWLTVAGKGRRRWQRSFDCRPLP